MRRGRDEIIFQILDVCVMGAIKTKIVHKANLNFSMVGPYITMLTKNGMLDAKEGSRVIYETTPKGKEVLKNFLTIESELLVSH